MWKEIVRLKVRFETSRGSISAEQLWDLSMPELDRLAIALQSQYKESGKKSFLVQKSKKDKLLKLKFDVVLDVLTTKVEEAEANATARANKEHNEKIMTLIAEKEEDSLKEKSISELKKMLKH